MSSKAIVVGSIAHVALMTGRSEEQVMADATHFVYIDASDSMTTPDGGEGGREKRWEVAKRELEKLQGEFPGQIVVVSWSDKEAEVCLNGIPRFIKGGTRLSGCLDLMEAFDGMVEHVIISDGEIFDYDLVANRLNALTSKIHTIYTGSKFDSNAKATLAKIAKNGRGTSGTTSQPGLIAERARAVLALPSAGGTSAGGAIAL